MAIERTVKINLRVASVQSIVSIVLVFHFNFSNIILNFKQSIKFHFNGNVMFFLHGRLLDDAPAARPRQIVGVSFGHCLSDPQKSRLFLLGC